MEQQLLFPEEPLPGEYPIPPGSPVRRCASCDAEIVWTRTEQGKPMPLSLKTARAVGSIRYATTHFADCEHAKQWRLR